MSNKAGRQNKLIDIIKIQGILPVRTLSTMLGVSEMTVRRDLEELKSSGLSETHSDQNGYNLLTALQKSNEQKNKIGKTAVKLLQPNDVIILDTGSTVVHMLQYLPEDYNLTILCYNANVLFELRYKPGIKILFCGGVYHPNTEMFESTEGIQFIRKTRANKVFLSAAGVHKELGITCANAYEVPTKQAIMQSSIEKILVVDSSKFDQVQSAYFCELSDINKVVTDKMISDDWKILMKQKGIQLYF